MQTMRAALLSLLLSSVVGSGLARAQQEPDRITLFKAASDDEGLAELAAALDPIVRAALGENPTIAIASQAAVDLPSLQLAIDCVGETADCLRAAGNQSEAQRLFAPSVRRTDSGILVTFLYFDPEHTQPIRTVERRYSGEGQGQAALSGVREMIAELFPVDADPAPPASPPPAAPEGAVSAPPPAAATTRQYEESLPILPIVLGGVGVALLGTGIAFGVMADASMDEYATIRPADGEDNAEGRELVRDAYAAFDRAETQGTVANVMFGVSAGVLIGAGVLFYWQMKERSNESQVALSPRLGLGEAGLTLTAAWNDAL